MKKAIVIGVYILSLALLLSLAIWQLQRGRYKAQLESAYAKSQVEAVAISGAQFNSLANYQRVQLSGHWLFQNSFLLQNRLHQRRLGVEVLTPFVPLDGEAIIVNRGWVSNNELKSLSFVVNNTQSELVGTVYKPNKGVTIGVAIIATDAWPLPSLYLDIAAFTEQLQRPLAEKILVLNAHHPTAYKKIWSPLTMRPSKHYGYAVQWLGLAITLVIFGFIWFSRSFKE